MYPGIVTGPFPKSKTTCSEPEHAGEAREQQRGLQQTDRKNGREVRQVLGVLLDALVGIDADLSGLQRPKRARMSHLSRIQPSWSRPRQGLKVRCPSRRGAWVLSASSCR
jgi:hypothetical protein